MFRKIDDFLASYKQLSESTARVLATLTDESINQTVVDGHRALGQIAWHIVATIPEMMGRTGLGLSSVNEHTPPPSTASEILEGYKAASSELLTVLKSTWTDETLTEIDDMYGQKWPRGMSLAALLSHEIHHRGQMTVLMRQAGLKVPGTSGPAKEEWTQYGMEAPPY
ncbi:DinB family protein [Candidatus Eisenbacteria bacterium]|uniref:DinB family protein n=1 Tax=Eiseniibacteriota bacterium TaxID=2212470 RepID=A0ABV6YM17_UNCEI